MSLRPESWTRSPPADATPCSKPRNQISDYTSGVTKPTPEVGPQIHPLPREFFIRDPRKVARELLGKVLVRNSPGYQKSALTARIVEVEAYLGENDPAAHSFAGRTRRNEVLFGPPGYAYVYFIYGNHYCLNVSCEPEGQAGGVLFRALEPLTGIEEMVRARGITIRTPRDLRLLTSGPGRLAEAFGITRVRDNGCDLTSSESSLWIGDDEYRPKRIVLSPRIGITKAADRKLRYTLTGSPFISGPKLVVGTP
jgi:DNA-3-methyladenine glycosylase